MSISNNTIIAPVKLSDVTSLVPGISSALRGGQVTKEFKENANYTSIAFPYCGAETNSEGVKSSLTLYPSYYGDYIGGHGFFTKCAKASFKGQQTAATSCIYSMRSSLYTFNPSQHKTPSAPANLGDWVGYKKDPYDYSTLVPANTPYTKYFKDIPFYFDVDSVTFSDSQISVRARYSAYMADKVETTLSQPTSIKSGWIGMNRMLATQGVNQLYLTVGVTHAPSQGIRKGGVEFWIANNGLEPLNASDNSFDAKTLDCTMGGIVDNKATNWDELTNKNHIWKGEILEVVPVLVASAQTIPVNSTGVTCRYCALPSSLYTVKAGKNGMQQRHCSASGQLMVNYVGGKWYFGVKTLSYKPLKSYGTVDENGDFFFFKISLTVFPENAASGSIGGQSVIQGRIQSYGTETRETASLQGYVDGGWKAWTNQIGKMYPTTIVPNGTDCQKDKTVRVQIAFTSPLNEFSSVEINVQLPSNTDDTTLVNFYV